MSSIRHNFQHPLGVGVQDDIDDFLGKIEGIERDDNLVGHLGAMQWVASFDEWSRYKAVGWRRPPLAWHLYSRETREEFAYAEKVALERQFVARIRRHLISGEWIASGIPEGFCELRPIPADMWINFDGFSHDGGGAFGAVTFEALQFRRVAAGPPQRTSAHEFQDQAVAFLKKLAINEPGRRSVDELNELIRNAFPSARFSDHALKSIRSRANVKKLKLVGVGPIPRN